LNAITRPPLIDRMAECLRAILTAHSGTRAEVQAIVAAEPVLAASDELRSAPPLPRLRHADAPMKVQSLTLMPNVHFLVRDSRDIGGVYAEEEARRLAACWNACIGIETATLEAMAQTSDVGHVSSVAGFALACAAAEEQPA
jgi:hypothetical protein